MTWDGFADELQKISGVSLTGVSAETVLSQNPPAPMETRGVEQAKQILSKATMMKTAAKKKQKASPVFGNPSSTVLPKFESTHPDGALANKVPNQRDGFDHGKSLAARSIAGAGVGKMLAGATLKKGVVPSARRQTIGMMIGAGTGLAEYGVERLRKKKTAGLMTPALQFRSARMTGTVRSGAKKGLASMASLTPKI